VASNFAFFSLIGLFSLYGQPQLLTLSQPALTALVLCKLRCYQIFFELQRDSNFGAFGQYFWRLAK
jgi:hypothetical protein